MHVMNKIFSLLFLSFALLLAVSCGPGVPPPEGRPLSANPLFRDASKSPEERAKDLLGYMSLDEKIGQMTQAARDYVTNTSDITDRALGSLLSGGGSTPSINRVENWADMYDGYQQAALKTRLAIPLIYGIDAVHGNNNLAGAVIFPHNIGLGATRNPALVEEIARITALETAATGIDWTFAPCVAIPQDERWGRTYEGFGEDTALVSELGVAAIRGYQGATAGQLQTLGDSPSAILACAKHYIGDGGTTMGVDQGNTEVTEEELRAIYLPPYQEAIKAGVETIMVSFSSWNGVKMHQQGYLINDVLKKELGFKGFIVSDWAGVKQLPGTSAKQIELAINAGIDMVMVPDDWKAFMGTLKKLVQDEKVPLSRIDDAVTRILVSKFKLGLFEKPLADRSMLGTVGSDEHRQLARQAVQESLVVLKNNKVLPISGSVKTIALVGSAADDIGAQCGGWTITWQGSNGAITAGTTIKQALEKALPPGVKLIHTDDATTIARADLAIVVAAEAPYAEMKGDDPRLDFPASGSTAIATLNAKGIPVVTILLSGRPLVANTEIAGSEAFIAAWLPGTEADGIADILLGTVKPRGTLSYTWFDSVDAIPVNSVGPGPGVLFPYGHGLTW